MSNQPLLTDDSPIAIGGRLKKIRKMTGLSVEEFAEKLGYTRQSISYWENANNHGLSQKGAMAVVQFVKNYGILCDVAWLMYGVGEVYTLPSWKNLSPQAVTADKNEKIHIKHFHIYQEIDLFTRSHKEAIVTEITHSMLEPFWQKGDWVGGCFAPITKEQLGKICILEVGDSVEVRMLQPGDSSNAYNVSFINHNQDDTSLPFERKNIALKDAALITRLWRK